MNSERAKLIRVLREVTEDEYDRAPMDWCSQTAEDERWSWIIDRTYGRLFLNETAHPSPFGPERIDSHGNN